MRRPRGEMYNNLPTVLEKLAWMRQVALWPNGPRYLWTDAFGLVLLVSLYRELGDAFYLRQAEELVAEVDRVLGRARGVRIGEAADRDGQYFHYLALWIYALGRLGRIRSEYARKGVELARAIHPYFVRPGRGVMWKMKEDLSGPYPGYGYGALDPFHGYVVCRLLAPGELSSEIADFAELVEASYRSLQLDQDLGLGMMLWMTHFFPDEPWAQFQRRRSLSVLRSMWVDPPGYFCRHPGLDEVRFAFTNYGVSLGLQAVGEEGEKVRRINRYFSTFRSEDHYDADAITHVMACVSLFPGEFIPDA